MKFGLLTRRFANILTKRKSPQLSTLKDLLAVIVRLVPLWGCHEAMLRKLLQK
ncbi:hypothetical protein F444_22659 [Phytophthora nicotianae P1976]|uniref:Uncharacterized protein n=1 Tax=Phytophthora nicotianae P1976 TaxID=1317066 RepID=A0A080YX51_PHYNI|nr:hypothetical protein F444_22659 [Phytophthora nicotianae P1976]